MKKQLQQGDVCFLKIDAIPSGVEAKKRDHRGIVLAEGEATGHYHGIMEAEDKATLYISQTGELYLDVKADKVSVKHAEHKPVTLEKGSYMVGQVNEYDYISMMKRKVVD